MSTEVADAIVIGAGPNGLVAANILADAGWSVLVLEAADVPGGTVRTEEVTAEGFRNDLCSAFYPLAVASPVLAELDLPRYGLRWRHAPAVLAHPLPDERAAVLSRDLDATCRSLAAFASADANAWRVEQERWAEIRTELLDLILRPFPPIRPGVRLFRELGTARSVRLARMLTLPVGRLASERFAGLGARLLLYGNALHSDLPLASPGSGLFGWLLAMLGQDVGFPVPEGGAGQLTAALHRRLRERGGRVMGGRAVTQVLIARGRALGVRDAHGEIVRARGAVLADVFAPHLYQRMIAAEHLPDRLHQDIRAFARDYPTIKVDWALDGPIPWNASEVSGAGTVHLGGDIPDMHDYDSALIRRELPESPFILLGQLTTADPTRSPAGTESVWAYTHVPEAHGWDADSLRRHADRMQRVIEGYAPGFTGRIRARHVRGPNELENHDPNLVGGNINGGTFELSQQLIFRPVPGLARADTPVDRLYLASASAHPGGGVHGGPGANAARAALARTGVGGELYAHLVQGAHRLVYADS